MFPQFKVDVFVDAVFRGAYNNATQYTFIVSTRPTSNAGQLSSGTSLGAAAIRAIDEAILTISHNMNPTAAVPAFREEKRPVSPRAKMAAGITTASAPYPADHPTFCLPVSAQDASATTNPTTSCPATTHQGETGGFCSRSLRASCAVNRLKGGSSSIVSGSGAIFFIGMPRPPSGLKFQNLLIISRNPGIFANPTVTSGYGCMSQVF